MRKAMCGREEVTFCLLRSDALAEIGVRTGKIFVETVDKEVYML